MRNETSPNNAGRPYVKFVRARPGMSLTIRPMVASVTLSRMHRISKRSIPCVQPPCPFCAAGEPLDSRVYLLGKQDGCGDLIFVDLPGSHYSYLADLSETSGDLSLFMLKIARLGPHENSPLGIRPVGRFPESADIFIPAWVDAVLDRNFSSNLRIELLKVAGEEKQSTTIAPSDTSPLPPNPFRGQIPERDRMYFRQLVYELTNRPAEG